MVHVGMVREHSPRPPADLAAQSWESNPPIPSSPSSRKITGPQPDLAQEPSRGLKITRSHNVIHLFLSDTGSPGTPGVAISRIISIHPSTCPLYNENPSTTATSVFCVLGDLVLASPKGFKSTKAVREEVRRRENASCTLGLLHREHGAHPEFGIFYPKFRY